MRPSFSVFFPSSFLSVSFLTMASTRPRRAATLPRVAPNLVEIQDRAFDISDSELLKEVQNVTKYYKNDEVDLAEFWFDGTPYTMKSQAHLTLLAYVLQSTGFKHPRVFSFLKHLPRDTLAALNVVRVVRGDTIYFRNYTGEHA